MPRGGWYKDLGRHAAGVGITAGHGVLGVGTKTPELRGAPSSCTIKHMTNTENTPKDMVGDYQIIPTPDGYRVMEQFGSYRLLANKFKTRAAAAKRATALPGK